MASRRHIENISAVVDKAVADAGICLSDVDAVAVTYGPGLVGALLVGVSTAKGLAYGLKKPLIPVHHIKGHICANYLENPEFKPPFICLVASGGHSHIVYVKSYFAYEALARTCDDAAGEAFDKVSRVLGYGYPGGPAIQKAVVDVLSSHLLDCAGKYGVSRIALAGGVAANLPLRKRVEEKAKAAGMEFSCPRLAYCTDNAAMIGCAAYYAWQNGEMADMSLNAVANLSL